MSGGDQSRDLAEFQRQISNKLASAANEKKEKYCLPVQVHDETWFFRAEDIRRVVVPSKTVPVPGAPSHVVGIIALAGTIYTLVDFNVLNQRSPVRPSMGVRVLCLQHQSDLALLVERTGDVVAVREMAEIKAEEHALSDWRSTAVLGGRVASIQKVARIAEAGVING